MAVRYVTNVSNINLLSRYTEVISSRTKYMISYHLLMEKTVFGESKDIKKKKNR